MLYPIQKLLCVAAVLMTGPAFAVVTFTETFDTGANGWLNGSSAAPGWSATGGVGNSGYIFWDRGTISTGEGSTFEGAPAGMVASILFRGNNTADASGDAFVGNWLESGVISLSLSIRHNHTSDLIFYGRIAGTAGAGASSSYDTLFAVAPNTWTMITLPITDSNPPWLSYGAGTFSSLFSNVQNLQLGLYLPEYTEFVDFKIDLDNVGIVAIPEPSVLALLAAGLGLLAWKMRRRQLLSSAKNA